MAGTTAAICCLAVYVLRCTFADPINQETTIPSSRQAGKPVYALQNASVAVGVPTKAGVASLVESLVQWQPCPAGVLANFKVPIAQSRIPKAHFAKHSTRTEDACARECLATQNPRCAGFAFGGAKPKYNCMMYVSNALLRKKKRSRRWALYISNSPTTTETVCRELAGSGAGAGVTPAARLAIPAATMEATEALVVAVHFPASCLTVTAEYVRASLALYLPGGNSSHMHVYCANHSKATPNMLSAVVAFAGTANADAVAFYTRAVQKEVVIMVQHAAKLAVPIHPGEVSGWSFGALPTPPPTQRPAFNCDVRDKHGNPSKQMCRTALPPRQLGACLWHMPTADFVHGSCVLVPSNDSAGSGAAANEENKQEDTGSQLADIWTSYIIAFAVLGFLLIVAVSAACYIGAARWRRMRRQHLGGETGPGGILQINGKRDKKANKTHSTKMNKKRNEMQTNHDPYLATGTDVRDPYRATYSTGRDPHLHTRSTSGTSYDQQVGRFKWGQYTLTSTLAYSGRYTLTYILDLYFSYLYPQGQFQLLPPAPPYYPFPREKLHTRGTIWSFTAG